MKTGTILIVFTWSVLSIVSCRSIPGKFNSSQPTIKKGILDLSHWDFKNDGQLDLSGKWEFYWNQLLVSDDFSGKTPPVKTTDLDVPGQWTEFALDGDKLPNYGFGTYRLNVILPPLAKQMALKLPDVYTNYIMFVNGRQIHTTGQVSTSMETAAPSFNSIVKYIKTSDHRMEFIIQVSNYRHQKAGIKKTITLGYEESIRFSQLRNMGFRIFFFGSILITCIYNLGLYAIRRTEKSILYFGGFCFLIVIRLMQWESPCLQSMIFDIGWEWHIKLSYLSYYLAITFFSLFIYSVFTIEFSDISLRIIQVLGVGFSLIVVFTGSHIFTYTLQVYHLLTILICSYIFYVIMKAYQNRREGSKFLLISFSCILIIFINDVLNDIDLINTGDYILYGLFVFIVFQSFIFSLRFSKAFYVVESLSSELKEKSSELTQKNLQLEKYNDQMERLVADRTKELHESLQKVEKAKIEIEAASKAKADFMATMSHEIRTPMNGIIGMTNLLRHTILSAEQRKYVDTIRISGDDLLMIINDILDFSKIDAGKLDLEEQTFNLHRCIEDTLDLFAIKTAEKRVELLYFIESDVPTHIHADMTRLRQILVNLIDNALKFTFIGEIHLLISRISQVNDKTEIQFSIKDSGIGIPENRLEQLFNSFTQVDSSVSRKFGGTGLGLAICKKLAELMGGKIWVDSIAGRGSTFCFTITAKNSTVNLPSFHQVIIDPDEDRSHVLIVDDHSINRDLLAKLCNQWKIISTTASSGSKALKLLQSGKEFNIVVMDMRILDKEDTNLITKIHRIKSCRNMPIIILSFVGKFQQRNIKNKYTVCLSKPINHSQLKRAIIKTFDRNIELDEATDIKAENYLDPGLAKRYPVKILLAEDNAVNQMLMLRTLELLGYNADIAANGYEVLDALKKRHYDLILMDIQMPEMSGLEAAQHIVQSYPVHKRPKIIAITANALLEDKEEYLSVGMDDYISKPVNPKTIQSTLSLWGDKIINGKIKENIPNAHLQYEVLDYNMLKTSRELGEDFFEKVKNKFNELAPKLILQIKEYCKENNNQKTVELSHQLKGMCSNVGAKNMREICMNIESSQDLEDPLDINELISQLEEAYANTQYELEKLV